MTHTRSCPTPDECSIVLELRAVIVRLRAQIEDACKAFEHYDLPEHALHYRRVALGMTAKQALGFDEQSTREPTK